MANAINAMKNIISDRLWYLKIGVLAIPVYFYLTDKKVILTLFENDLIFWVILSVLYLGVSSVLIHRNVNNKYPIMPSLLDIIDIIRRSLCSLLVALPGLVSLFGVLYLLNTYLPYLTDNLKIIAHIACIVILFPFISIPVVIYSVNGKLTDIFRVRNLQSASGDFIVSFLAFIIQYALTVALFTYLIYEAFKTFYGESFIGIPILFSFVITFSYIMLFSWVSDLYGQVIPSIEENKEKTERRNRKNKTLR